MGHEIEAKFPVASHVALRRRLRANHAEFLGTYVQTDRFYDTNRRSYYQNGSGLRLRCLKILKSGAQPLDPRPQITFKGPVHSNAKAKIRREIQTRLDCGDSARELLLACGLTEIVQIQKRRSSYRLGDCLVELDTVPSLGTFVEIEGPGEEAIEAVRRQLGITAEHIPASYLHLLAQRGKRGKKLLDKFGDRS